MKLMAKVLFLAVSFAHLFASAKSMEQTSANSADNKDADNYYNETPSVKNNRPTTNSNTNSVDSSGTPINNRNNTFGTGAAAVTAPDNTDINERDRAKSAVTADQQGNSPEDIRITQRIRQELMKDGKLSTYAQNVKIITISGRVTLKGPVGSAAEEAAVLQKARAVAGKSSIVNQLSVVK